MACDETIVSIVVPVYNAAPYVGRCIDSILGQTYQDVQVIMVDDGSTDSSADICREYVKKDNRCIYIHQENAGPDYARKTGVINATGQYLMFFDADDYADKNS